MIGDFDDSADALWSLHGKEARRSDEIRIQSLKDDMGGVLIFVCVYMMTVCPLLTDSLQAGLFSAVLTGFIIDKINDLQVDPTQQMVYYQQQNVALLAQISQQVSSIAPQVPIPSAPPPPYPNFSPKTSDIRVIAYWLVSLVFSLSAALLATLVPRWLRDYMYVFQQYTSPLKSTRLRQYLYEGAEGWYLLAVAESVPVQVHISLFLLFLGLGDELLSQNRIIGVIATIFITTCSLLYVFTMFAPVLSPQSPFKTSFSGLIWYLIQKVHPRRYLDHTSGGELKPVSSEMTEAQMQLAMEENDERKRRDMRAIQWLLDRLTEDDEMESFVLAIPGSFTTEWGIEVWRKASEVMQHDGAISDILPARTYSVLPGAVLPRHDPPPPQSTSCLRSIFHPMGRIIGIRTANGTLQWTTHTPTGGQSSIIPHSYGDLAVHELCKRVRLLFGTCNNRGLFASEDLWRRRARGCVETASLLVCCAGIKLDAFEDIGELLGDLGKVEKICELSAARSDESFVTRWTCLSLVAARGIAYDARILQSAYQAIVELSRFQMENDGDQTTSRDADEKALKGAQLIDCAFKCAKDICLNAIQSVFRSSEGFRTKEEVRKVLAGNQRIIPGLDLADSLADSMSPVDMHSFFLSRRIRQFYRGLIENLPGVFFEDTHATELTPPNQIFKKFVDERPTVIPQFIFLRKRLQRLTSYGPKLRDVVEGRGEGVYEEILETMPDIWDLDYEWGLIAYAEDLMERQFWRLQDIRDGGGFGLVVELFFLTLAQLLSTASSQHSHSSLYIGTLRAITSDWRQHKHSIGTQRVILNLVCDLAVDSVGMFSAHNYPRYITDELLILLGHMVEGQSGSHIDDALNQLENPRKEFRMELEHRAFVQGAISRLRPPVSSS